MKRQSEKLSPKYRDDPSEGIDPEMRDYLDDNYFAKLDNIHHYNPKLLVVFAGGNAVGKTTLAKKIELELGGLRLENDGVKRAVLSKFTDIAMTDELHNITWQYTMDLYKRLESLTTNGLVIRDGIITWYYDRILPIFRERGYEIFVVGYDLSEKKMKQLIETRGDTATSTAIRFFELLPDQQIHLKRFFANNMADVMLNDESVFDHDMVIDAIRVKLASMAD